MPGGGYSINTRWYLDVNTLARDSSWAHGVMTFYSHLFGLGLLALLLLAAWWRARSSVWPAKAVAAVLWAAGGTVAAWAVAHYVLKPAVAEPRPYLVLAHVEVLLSRTRGFSFPSGHATIAGAVLAGLWMARRWVIAAVASVLGLLLDFGRIYTGMHYPFDVVGGMAFGAAFVAVLWPAAVAALSRWDSFLLDTRFAPLVSADRVAAVSSAGPAESQPGWASAGRYARRAPGDGPLR